MAQKRTNKATGDPILAELDAIKRLITLLLLKAGAPQSEIAMALDVDQSVISRMIPARKVTKFESAK